MIDAVSGSTRWSTGLSPGGADLPSSEPAATLMPGARQPVGLWSPLPAQGATHVLAGVHYQ